MVMEILNNQENAAPQVNPREFNGQWFFTNPDGEDFTFFWNGTPYIFPAQSTSDFVIMDATPREMQNIRKNAARKLAERMFGKSDRYKELLKKSKDQYVPQFFDQTVELQKYIDMCLQPLPVKKTKVGKKEEKQFHQNIDPATGKPAVRVMGEADQNTTSLVAESINQ